MHNGWQVGVVVPAKNEEAFILDVLKSMPECVDNVIVIDDGSVDNTANIVKQYNSEQYNLELISLEGCGVGAAIDSGHQKMLLTCQKPFVSVVMAGDGQMDPQDLLNLITPITRNKFDYVKGNRFGHAEGVSNMPLIRKIASLILAFLTTLASGRKIHDPQCGYTASSYLLLEEWNWQKSWPKYGYPNYWLIELSTRCYRVGEVPVRSVYGEEKSNLQIFTFFISVGIMMVIMHHKRCLRMLFSRSVTPHSLFSLIAYVIGWIALLPNISTDIERELPSNYLVILMFTLGCWTCAHIFDRLAVKTRLELRINAQT